MSFLLRDEGQGLAEYALILVAVFATVLAGLGLFGINIVGLFSDVVGAIHGLIGS